MYGVRFGLPMLNLESYPGVEYGADMRLLRLRCLSFPCFLLPLACSSEPQDSWHSDPADVKIVNDDVSRFWTAYDELSEQTSADAKVATLQARYLDAASPTLKSFSQALGITAQSSHLIKLNLAIDALPEIVAHEVAHAQQPYFSGRQTELFWIIIEGSADFLAELVTGRLVSPDRMEYGNAHEAELWASLKQTRDNLGKGSWFREEPGQNPGGLGYYMGYQITKSYYERQRDPKRAVHDILNIADFSLFLEESGYASKFE
jgi:uncharacterized protein YjaZ